MANYQTLGSVELECEELMTTHEPIFTIMKVIKILTVEKFGG